MKATKNRTIVMTSAATAMLGLALIALASCSSGDSTQNKPRPTAAQRCRDRWLFVNNTGERP